MKDTPRARPAKTVAPTGRLAVKTPPTGRMVARPVVQLALDSAGGVDSGWRSKERARFVVEVVGGTRKTADLLDVAPSQPSRWVSGESIPGPLQARFLVDVEYVLTHALLIWGDHAVARDWLTTPNAHLDFARPVDWVRVHGTNEVVDALRAEAEGAYA